MVYSQPNCTPLWLRTHCEFVNWSRVVAVQLNLHLEKVLSNYRLTQTSLTFQVSLFCSMKQTRRENSSITKCGSKEWKRDLAKDPAGFECRPFEAPGAFRSTDGRLGKSFRLSTAQKSSPTILKQSTHTITISHTRSRPVTLLPTAYRFDGFLIAPVTEDLAPSSLLEYNCSHWFDNWEM